MGRLVRPSSSDLLAARAIIAARRPLRPPPGPPRRASALLDARRAGFGLSRATLRRLHGVLGRDWERRQSLLAGGPSAAAWAGRRVARHLRYAVRAAKSAEAVR